MHHRFTAVLRVGIFVVLLVRMVFQSQPVQAGGVPAGYSEYFIPGGAQQLYALLLDNDTATTGNNMNNVITISVAAPVTIYYDHWENNYNNASGVYTNHLGAHFDERYTAVKGDVITFTSPTVPSNPRGTGLTACSGSTVVRSGTTLLGSTN